MNVVTGADLGPQVCIMPGRLRLVFPVRNGGTYKGPNPHKPDVGLWTSSLTPDGGSAWISWCEDEDFHVLDPWSGWLVRPSPRVRILAVDSVADLAAICHEYGTRIADYLPMPALDFERMARDGYYGMHLTERGQWRTRHSSPNLYGWDCESTIWFRWAFARPVRYERRSPVRQSSQVLA